MKIDNEIMQYTSATVDQLSGVTRGASATTAAAHTAGALVYLSDGVSALVWAPISNTFDPSLIYGKWPGTVETTLKTDSVAVNIGTMIYVLDGAGTAWLFRAQNSGVTGFGPTYPGPQFFPENGREGIDGAMTSGSAVLTSTLGSNVVAGIHRIYGWTANHSHWRGRRRRQPDDDGPKLHERHQHHARSGGRDHGERR